jgi:hypothetical protein
MSAYFADITYGTITWDTVHTLVRLLVQFSSYLVLMIMALTINCFQCVWISWRYLNTCGYHRALAYCTWRWTVESRWHIMESTNACGYSLSIRSRFPKFLCWNLSDPDIWPWLDWSNYDRLSILVMWVGENEWFKNSCVWFLNNCLSSLWWFVLWLVYISCPVFALIAYPCGGGLEYLHRCPACRKRRQKGNPVPWGITEPPCSWGI